MHLLASERSLKLHVCYVNAFYDSDLRSPDELIDRYYSARELARHQVELGNRVTVLQLFQSELTILRDGVNWQFVQPTPVIDRAGAYIGRRQSAPEVHYQPALPLARTIERLTPDVVHFFGLTLDLNLRGVSRTCKRMGIPLVVQYNGGRPPASRVRRAIQRGNLRRADRALFTTMEHARPWLSSHFNLSEHKVVEIMETSSSFKWEPRLHARSLTGMSGKPVFLWAGRLHPEKDPITALEAFSRIVKQWPGARLYVYCLTDEMLPEVRKFVIDRQQLLGRVFFRGRAPYREMETIYNSADVLLQASTREASGCAVLEAMSCGVIPAVTDIPSFRAMTDGGRYGTLFPIGDSQSLAEQILSIPLDELPHRSKQVRQHFQKSLSFPALARQLRDLYAEVISGKTSALREEAS